MNIAELAPLGLAGLAKAIRDRRVSSQEATRACLDGLETHGRRLGYLAGIDPETALAQAATADRLLASGRPVGPLHGVPLAHKDLFYRQGRISACGSRIRAEFYPPVTASVLGRLDAAGALDVARLNMVEFALGTTGHNEITGTPANPWNPAYITGGSSSASGGAVAAGLVAASLGSDTGGSVRIPASCCGVVGIKPTYGRISRHGTMVLSWTLDHVGVLTRTVRDCALMLQIIAGADPADPTSSHQPVPDYAQNLENGVSGLRIAIERDYFYASVDPAVARHMDASLEVYRSLGTEIVPVKIPWLELANPMTTMILAVEAASGHAEWLRERAQEYGRQTLGRLLAGLLYPATRYLEALKLRQQLLKSFADVFDRADLIHLPVLPFQVPTIIESDLAANPGFSEFLVATGHCTRPFNYLGLPAISVPAGCSENGLPCGFQLAGRPFSEPLLLQAARAYERETGSTDTRPSLS
jgi:aspartyl-tRNA(Asn)/glutamyl-tRNA(Gln) amidotransferase subunit A